jgi:RNA polymerase sigma-70 factor (ECF subfamily)
MGIGGATARRLAEDGARVLIVDVEDQSYEAAAEVLGVPIGTVRSRLFRGRRLLQELLQSYARDAGFTSVEKPQGTRIG